MTEAERDLLLLLAKTVAVMDGASEVPPEDWDKLRDGISMLTDIVEGRP